MKWLSLLLVVGLVSGCSKPNDSFLITDEILIKMKRYAFVDGYYEGHRDAIHGTEISHEMAEKRADVYADILESK